VRLLADVRGFPQHIPANHDSLPRPPQLPSTGVNVSSSVLTKTAYVTSTQSRQSSRRRPSYTWPRISYAALFNFNVPWL